jgi:hypothetical protein
LGRNCSICSQSSAATINAELRSGRSARSVAIEFGLGEDSMERHRRHLPSEAESNVTPTGADPLDEMVNALRPRMLDGHPSLTREYRLAIADRAAAGRAAVPAVDLATTADWIRLRDAMLEALRPWPDARRAIAAVIAGWD